MSTEFRIFIDTEFNGFYGELLSLALVPEQEIVPEYYQTFASKTLVDPWVQKHVTPYLHHYPRSTCLLSQWLNECAHAAGADTLVVIADWPDDGRHLLDQVITGPGEMINQNYKLQIHIERDMCEGPFRPWIPHNALCDATTNMYNYFWNLSEDSDEEE